MYCATKILLIGDSGDDQSAQRAAIAISGAEPGWQLEFRESGRAALDDVGALRPDCIVLDDQLPDMNALDCFRALRSPPENAVPVLMLAAPNGRWNASEALALGVQDYLYKDQRGNYLALLPAVLKKVLREHREALALRSAQDALSAFRHSFEQLFSEVSDGVVLVDEAWSVQSINPAACRLFGAGADDVQGRPLASLMRPAAHDRGFGPGRHRVRARGRDGAALALDVAVTELGFEGRRLFACVVQRCGVGPGADLTDRAGFAAAAVRLLRSAASGPHSLVLLRFGRIDDVRRTCGEDAGDRLLEQIEVLLGRQLRKSDCLARLSPGEYVALLPGCSSERAGEVAGKLVDQVRSFGFDWGGRRFTLDLGAAVGAADGDAHDVDAQLAAAVQACARASRSSRFHVQFLPGCEAARRRAAGRPDWVARLKRAIERDELELFFQRIEPLSGGTPGPNFEVLLRYRDDDGGVHLPGDFIPAAERHGMLAALDRWVVERLLRNPLPAAVACYPDSVLSVNLSGAAMADPGFAEFALRKLRSSGLPACRVCFEISEASAIGNLAQAARLMHGLKPEGFRFALDDFDGGLNSFGCLGSLPVDYLKVNRDQGTGSGARDAYFATVDAVHKVACGMGIAMVAKSVESESELERLRSLGIEYAQGYRVHAPEPLFPLA